MPWRKKWELLGRDIAVPAATALEAGCEGISAINTITSVMGVNLDTLRPEPCVEGYSTPGGYSSKAVRPIALAKVPSPLVSRQRVRSCRVLVPCRLASFALACEEQGRPSLRPDQQASLAVWAPAKSQAWRMACKRRLVSVLRRALFTIPDIPVVGGR